MRIYINDNQIVKTVSDDFIATEYFDPSWTYLDSVLPEGSHLVYENSQAILYKDSQAIQTRHAELNAIVELSVNQQQELEYINSLLN